MSRFGKNSQRKVPSLNTASLPDMIFTLLFFFMIVSNMREAPHRLQFRIPTATELEKLDKESLVSYIFVNKEGEIQFDYSILPLSALSAAIEQKISKIPEGKRDKMVVSLKIDKETRMGLVNDIKQIVRNSGILLIHFAADPEILNK
ncbi:biopolymer transporter ExbD [Bacteroidia bacterium]|nr:biopolymer transporter ExbD [Bacteroidia bacterium]GHV23850.1 biopolymer transporter ExbD [Bacteroidia bacterium]